MTGSFPEAGLWAVTGIEQVGLHFGCSSLPELPPER